MTRNQLVSLPGASALGGSSACAVGLTYVARSSDTTLRTSSVLALLVFRKLKHEVKILGNEVAKV